MTAQLETQLETLSSYLPALIAKRAATTGAPPLRPEARAIHAVAVFSDISSFTVVTERATREGPEGVERLTLALSDIFGVLIDTISKHGGDIEKLAGDAILAFWLADETCSMEEAALRA